MTFIIATKKTFKLAQQVGLSLQIPIYQIESKKFSDGEIKLQNFPPIEGEQIICVASSQMPSENFLETLMLLSEIKRRNPKRFILVMPYMSFSRQDRQSEDGDALNSLNAINLICSTGISDIVIVQPHDKFTSEYFKNNGVQVTELNLIDLVEQKFIDGKELDVVVVSPDNGSSELAASYAEKHSLKHAYFDKERFSDGSLSLKLQESFKEIIKHHSVILIDDLIDTAGTVVCALKVLIECKAKNVEVLVVHGLFSGSALDRLSDSPVTKINVFDTTNLDIDVIEKLNSRLVVHSIVNAVALTLRKILNISYIK